VAPVPKKPNWIAIGAIGLLVAAGLGWFLTRGGDDAPTVSKSGPSPDSASEGEAVAANGRQMIVVLPFENLGPAEDEYFADGMSEEITSRLSAVGGLGVISRSSARQYKDNRPDIQQIGQELGVDYVLEGTVRWERSEDGASRIRVTPQLIRVDDDTSVWSDRYDRELEQIFEVQSEIAETVTRAVGVTLVDSEKAALSARMTDNIDAYQAYLRGLENFHHPDFSEETLGTAVSMFRRATELDPEFAQAWGMLSYATSRYHWFLGDFQSDWVPAAREAAERSLAINSQLPEGRLALGYVHYYGERDYRAALKVFQDLEADRPNDSDIAAANGFVLRRLGRFDESLSRLKLSIELNPKSADRLVALADTYGRLRMWDEALVATDRAIALVPDQVGGYVNKVGLIYSRDGDLEAAGKVLDQIPNQEGEFAIFNRVTYLTFKGLYDEGLLLLDQSPMKDFGNATGSYYPKVLLQAHMHALNGEDRLAKASAEHAVSLLEPFVQANPKSAFSHGYLGEAYALAQRPEDAIRMAQEAVDLFPISVDTMYGPLMVAELAYVYALVGQIDDAIDQIEIVLSIPASVSINDYLINPRFTAVVEHPRFKALAEKYGG
jgi:TolB-like protein/Flp pilus assembly protein TadD